MAGVREVDLQRRFRYSATELAQKLDLTVNRAAALKWHLGIDGEKDCMHEFTFGSQKHKRYSDTAIQKMQAAKQTLNLNATWKEMIAKKRSERSAAVTNR